MKLTKSKAIAPKKGGYFFSFLLALVIICGLLSSCSPSYVITAAWNEAKILYNSRPIEEYLKTEHVDQKIKHNLILSKEIRSFAIELGLDPKNNYKELSLLEEEPVTWVVSACEKLEFKPKTWWFPIVGSFPYKGFFDQADAIKLKNKLEKEGYDTIIGKSVAFSTLGWFQDPLLESMTKQDQVSFAGTLFHEMVHTTFWIKNNVILNESLANFISYHTTALFFKEKNYEELSEIAHKRLENYKLYSSTINHYKNKLSQLYSSSISDEEKLKRKNLIFDEIHTKYFKHKNRSDINNAFLISSLTYNSYFDEFSQLLKEAGTFQEFIANLNEKVLIAKVNKQKNG